MTLRIWVIALLPSIMFYIGLLHLDQYRETVISSETDALMRQGNTLARSIGFTDSQYSELAQRRLSQLTTERARQLIASIPNARIRIFQPNGVLISDSASGGITASPPIVLGLNPQGQSGARHWLRRAVSSITDFFTPDEYYPPYQEKSNQSAFDFPAVVAAFEGEQSSLIMRGRDGGLIIGAAVPIRHLRVVRGALLVTASGEAAERDIRSVEEGFFMIFMGIFVLTLVLGYYLARSIIDPITRLARAADEVRLSRGKAISLPKMVERKDEIGGLARDLGAMTDELYERMQATASFAADVAHEIKNPLTSLRSAVETITRLDDEKQKKKLLAVILADVVRLDRLISDISAASRIDAALSSAEFEPIDLKGLVENFAKAREHEAMDKGLTLKIVTPTEEVMVKAIVDRLVQVLDNLYANALSFSPKGGAITIGAEVDSKTNTAILSVEDEGAGIPQGKLEDIFKRFYSERPSTEKFGEHSGLGLSISRTIIEAHGGTLTARNRKKSAKEKSGGAILRITLPIYDIS